MKILLVEDDHLIGKALEQALHDSSFAVNWVREGLAVISAVETETYDLILLDLGLPKLNGIEVLKNLRKQKNDVPIVIITAKDSVEDKVLGLDLGADDYLVKPFSIEELLARIRATLRRRHGHSESILSNGILSLNLATKEVEQDGQKFTLSSREYALMHQMMLSPGILFSKEQLENKVYGWNEEVESNAIEVIIHGIRKKLGKHSIKNIRGLGWMVSK